MTKIRNKTSLWAQKKCQGTKEKGMSMLFVAMVTKSGLKASKILLQKLDLRF